MDLDLKQHPLIILISILKKDSKVPRNFTLEIYITSLILTHENCL